MLASATNDRQVKAIVDEVEDKLREIGAKPIRREGERDGRWVLIDYGEIVVHVQHEEERQFYALERLWRDCPTIDAARPTSPPAAEAAAPGGSSCSGTARPPGTPSGAPRATPTSSSTTPARAQAAAVAPYVAALRPPCVWSSDLARARETAAYVARPTGPRAGYDARLREYYLGERTG